MVDRSHITLINRMQRTLMHCKMFCNKILFVNEQTLFQTEIFALK